jgi:hypothetical protein
VEKDPDPTALSVVEQQYPESDAVYFFGDEPVNGDTNRLQPYVLLFGQDNKTPLLIAFLDGDFSGISPEGSKMDKIHRMVEKFLIPKISQLHRLAGGSLDKVLEELKTDLEQTTLLATCKEGSIITLMTWDGKITSFTKGEGNTRAYDWGWVSDHFGYGEKVPEPEPKKSGLAAIFGGGSTKPSAIPPQPTKGKEEPVIEAGDKPMTAKEAESVKAHTIPPHLKGKDKKNHIRAKMGFVPEGWEGIKVLLIPEQPAKGFEKLRELQSSAAAIPPQPASPDQLPVETDTATKHIEPAPVPEVAAIVSAEEKKKFEVYVKSVQDSKAKKIPSPDEITKSEFRLPSFVEVSPGIENLSEMYNLELSAYMVLAKEHWKHAALLIRDLCAVLKSRAPAAETPAQPDTSPAPAPTMTQQPLPAGIPPQPKRKVA